MDWGTHGITDIGKLFSKNEYVPHGLIIYIICEVYIDDMLTDWGGIPQEHRDRLRKITGVQCDIEPFINHVVLTTISFVGHAIDSYDINMSQKLVESTIYTTQWWRNHWQRWYRWQINQKTKSILQTDAGARIPSFKGLGKCMTQARLSIGYNIMHRRILY